MKRDFALAVKAVIIWQDKLLLLRRSKKEMQSSYINQREAWDLPGGGVRFFETAEKGLMREIKEETNLKVRVIKPLNIYDAIRNQLHLSIFTYICEYESGEVELSFEHDSFFWLTLEQLRQKDLPKWLMRDYEIAMDEYQHYIEQKQTEKMK